MLDRTAINVTTKIAEVGCTEVQVGQTLRGIELRRGAEVSQFQVTVNGLVDITAGLTRGHSGARCQARSECRGGQARSAPTRAGPRTYARQLGAPLAGRVPAHARPVA